MKFGKKEISLLLFIIFLILAVINFVTSARLANEATEQLSNFSSVGGEHMMYYFPACGNLMLAVVFGIVAVVSLFIHRKFSKQNEQ